MLRVQRFPNPRAFTWPLVIAFMRRIPLIIILLLAVIVPTTLSAQKRILGEVKKKISSLNPTIDLYKGAINTLKPALSHEETKDASETWFLEGKLQYSLYGKYVDTEKLGKKVDVKAMGHALINGYNGYTHALSLDTIVETDRKGNPKIDKKTGKIKTKTKFSGDIVKAFIAQHSNYNNVGGELYNVQDWVGAYDAWEIFCKLNNYLGNATGTYLPDSVIGQTRYYQALALWQKGDNKEAVKMFQVARNLGIERKECYDYALVCLSALGDETGIIKLAHEAYARFGASDAQYVRVLINDHINNKQFKKANELLDQIIEQNDSDAEIQNLKGIVMEQEAGMESALPYFKRCVELDPENVQGNFNLGRYYYNEATTLPEKNPRLTRKKLMVKLVPLYIKARPYLEKAYALDPSNTDAKNALRNIYYKLGEDKKLQQIEK